MDITELNTNLRNLNGLYRYVLMNLNQYSTLDFLEFPDNNISPWPPFTYSDHWIDNKESLNERLINLKEQIATSNAPKLIIVPYSELPVYSDSIFATNGFIPLKIWYSMNLMNPEENANRTKTIKEVETTKDKIDFLDIINQCHFPNNKITLDYFNSLHHLKDLTFYISTNNNIPCSACFCYKALQSMGIYMVSTLPGHRKKGLSTNMLQQIMEQKKKPLILQATRESLSIYKNLGFTINGYYIIYGLK